MRALVLACSAALLALGCGPSCPFPDPYPDGASCLDTCATDNARSRKECEAICSSDECSAEPTRAAALPLSVGLTLYTVTAASAPATATACNAGQGPWFNSMCSCGVDYTDAGAETCDDGGTVAGDGCSAACAIEAGYTCAGAPSACATTCGDGVKAGAEECDDGNAASADGCSAACVAEVCTCQ